MTPGRRRGGWARWHRRLGLVMIPWVVIVTLSGVLAQASRWWGWDKTYVQSSWLLSWYGVSTDRTLTGVEIRGVWYSVSAGRLWRDETAIADCGDVLYGVLTSGELLHAVCDRGVVLLTPSGDMVERIPTPLRALRVGVAGEQLLAEAGERCLAFDALASRWTSVECPGPGRVAWAESREIPHGRSIALAAAARERHLTWERWWLDVHSGRLLGPVGEWLVALAGVLLLLLAVSGGVTWWKRFR